MFQPQSRLIMAFCAAILFASYAIPVIILISKKKKLFDFPDERKNHEIAIPTLGGVGIYSSIVIVSLTFINTCGLNGGGIVSSLASLPPILAGLTILFFIGVKDDLIEISASKKLVAEILSLFILIVIGNVRLNSMQGMFNIGELDYWVSLLLSAFAGVVIINAFNLIDGIDGLAASISILACSIFGFYFYMVSDWEYAILSATVVGSVIPFFFYNAYGKKNKIFMGDTGSLILGFAVAVLVFRFNELNSYQSITPHLIAAPAFSFAVLILPMFDTLRVFTIRIYRGGSPFKADRRHLHHILLDLGFSHLRSTLILIIINILFIAFAYRFNYLGNSDLLYCMIGGACVLSFIAMSLLRRKNLKKSKA